MTDRDEVEMIKKVDRLESKIAILTELLMGYVEADSMRAPKINRVMIDIISYVESMNEMGRTVSKTSVVEIARCGRPPFFESQATVKKNLNKCLSEGFLIICLEGIEVGDPCIAFQYHRPVRPDDEQPIMNSTIKNICRFINNRAKDGLNTRKADLRKASGMQDPLWASARVVQREAQAAIDAGYIKVDKSNLVSVADEDIF